MDDQNAPASKGDILDLGTRVDSLGTRVDSLGTRVDSLGTRVDSLGTRVDSLGTRVDSLEARIDSFEARVDERFEQLRSEVNHGYRDLVERMDDGFTRVLNAFYGLAETHGKRLNELDSNEHAIRSRLSTVENRVMELEKRLLTPPSA